LDLSKPPTSAAEAERRLNLIDLIPEQIQVKDAHHWKKKDMSKVKDFK
jgi:hypothetical protein